MGSAGEQEEHSEDTSSPLTCTHDVPRPVLGVVVTMALGLTELTRTDQCVNSSKGGGHLSYLVHSIIPTL